ncbi:PadR family transcriptional regulator [Streptomonospora sp. S1-112]|uniref:PadR family transcriptional regulator n=1 Tax=Streptomonospora mangrovi TaxID=2883123 RepID=A0A9X3NM17_9ACTN|nr:PadR family transcriptional regulator [Streptomonospora mangrovi]MDA0566239.1 PadR family transcriptional regulator [Streptomonospora mangrovi]
MSATRLLVLGMVRSFGPAHGYQVRRELLSWGADTWANVKPGSIYHALRQLLKGGMLRSAGVEESGEGPERALFEVTAAGEEEFFRLLQEALSDAEAKPEYFGAAITFMTALPRSRALGLLRFRLEGLEKARRTAESLLGTEVMGYKPAHVYELFRSWVVAAEANEAFTRELIERLEGGAYSMAGEGGRAFGEPAAAPRGPGGVPGERRETG